MIEIYNLYLLYLSELGMLVSDVLEFSRMLHFRTWGGWLESLTSCYGVPDMGR